MCAGYVPAQLSIPPRLQDLRLGDNQLRGEDCEHVSETLFVAVMLQFSALREVGHVHYYLLIRRVQVRSLRLSSCKMFDEHWFFPALGLKVCDSLSAWKTRARTYSCLPLEE